MGNGEPFAVLRFADRRNGHRLHPPSAFDTPGGAVKFARSSRSALELLLEAREDDHQILGESGDYALRLRVEGYDRARSVAGRFPCGASDARLEGSISTGKRNQIAPRLDRMR